MKKTLKAFTLIECIVSMAILGISSALLVQAYGQLARVTRMNSAINNSVSLQMGDAENIAAAEASTGVVDSLTTSTSKRTYTITLDKSTVADPSTCENFQYNIDVNVFAVKPYSISDTQGGSTGEGMEYRYIYFHK